MRTMINIGITAIIPSYLKHKNDHRWASLGASGAVSAVLFAYILFEPWKLIFVFFIPVPAIIFAVLYVTLKQGVETTLKQHVPELMRVVDQTDHSQSEGAYFK